MIKQEEELTVEEMKLESERRKIEDEYNTVKHQLAIFEIMEILQKHKIKHNSLDKVFERIKNYVGYIPITCKPKEGFVEQANKELAELEDKLNKLKK